MRQIERVFYKRDKVGQMRQSAHLKKGLCGLCDVTKSDSLGVALQASPELDVVNA